MSFPFTSAATITERVHVYGHDHGHDQKRCPFLRVAARYAIKAQAMCTSAM